MRPRAETGILPGESLAQLAERTVGIAGPKTLASIVDANPQLKKAAEYQSWAVSDVLGGDAVVQIPFATSPTVYRLRPGYVGQAEVVLDMLRRELRGDAEGNEIAGGLRLESDIPAGAMLPAECPAAANPLANWPFDRAAVIEALARNAALRAQAGMPTVPAVTLAVADNGIDGLGSSFPTELLAINPGEVLKRPGFSGGCFV